MKTPSPLAKSALRALADAPLDIERPSTRDTEDAIASIAQELDAVRTRRRRQRIVGAACGALAFAAIAVFTIGFARRSEEPAATAAAVENVAGTVLLVRGPAGSTLATGGTVARGDRVVASASGSATLRLHKGTELRALDGADILVAEQGPSQIFDLRAGTVKLAVTKLAPGERFIVRTPDAEVEVRGTAFEVRVDPSAQRGGVGPCSSTPTRVNVTEGTVVVRHAGQEARVTVNESWPSGCIAQREPPPSPARERAPLEQPPPKHEEAPAATATHVAQPAPPIIAAPAAKPVASSDLAEQNRLFAEAMASKRQGNPAAALSALDRLIADHPQGPLAESASVERMRILAASDPARGAEAARAYLARHPKGYARDEAKKLASP